MTHGGDRYRNKVNMDFSINVNPLGMPETVTRNLHAAVENMIYYPDPQTQELTEALAGHFGLLSEYILLGNGASELLMAITRALPCQKVLLPVPSFGGYQWALAAAGADTHYYPLRQEDGFQLTEDFVQYLEKIPNADASGSNAPSGSHIDMLFLTNPNNPTGICIAPALLDQILEICRRKQIIVVLDECFMELSDHPEHSLIRKFKELDNLLILRAFTKSFAIPGIRLGYLVGNPNLLGKIRLYLPEWNVSGMAQAAGITAMKETAYLQQARELIAQERAYLTEELQKLGHETWPSETNFILFRERRQKIESVAESTDEHMEKGCAEDGTSENEILECWRVEKCADMQIERTLYQKMLSRGILIRDCSDYRGLEKGYYRIAVRTHEENVKLIEALKE